MSSTLRTLTLGLSIMFLLALSFTQVSAHDEGHGDETRRIKIIACDSSEVTDLTADDLALGETRDVETSCGKTISITRTFEDEIQVAVDGDEVHIPGADIDIEEIDEDGDGTVRRKIIIRSHGGDCEEGEECAGQHKVRKIIIGGDGDTEIDFMTLLGDDLLLDCDEDDEGCDSHILQLLSGGEMDGEGGDVVVIRKRVRHEHSEGDEDGEEE